jgi:hypothetical protein
MEIRFLKFNAFYQKCELVVSTLFFFFRIQEVNDKSAVICNTSQFKLPAERQNKKKIVLAQ